MSTTSYGAGTALQFSDGSQRQVLELGDKIHYYNPNVTPIFSLFGQQSVLTPVPIFEWMEDEYMIKKSEKFNITSSDVADTATGGANGLKSILIAERQAQMEMFEVGGIYSFSVAGGSAAVETGADHLICIAVGKDVDHASATDKMVQFIGAHAHGSLDAYLVEKSASALITADAAGVLTLSYVANAGQFYDAGTATGYYGYNIKGNFTLADITDNDYFDRENGVSGIAEGSAVGIETRKKVRRLKNCTQIFREPYEITRTARVSEQYGGPELARLQARKLAQIKVNVEYAMLFNGALSLDATSSNPTRAFQGFGVGNNNGVIQTNNGNANASFQLADSNGTQNQFDAILEAMFTDMVDGSMHKTVYASNKWLTKMVKMVRDTSNSGAQLNAQMGTESKAGLRVMEYIGPVGSVDFIPHPLLKGAYEDFAVAVDHANFDIRVLSESGFQLRRDIVKDGSDGQVDEWLVELGPEIRQEQTHAVLKLT